MLEKQNKLYGEKEIYQTVKSAYEEWCFGIEEGKVGAFLAAYDYALIENLEHGDLKRKYFSGHGPAVKINGTHCIAHAGKR